MVALLMTAVLVILVALLLLASGVRLVEQHEQGGSPLRSAPAGHPSPGPAADRSRADPVTSVWPRSTSRIRITPSRRRG